MSASTSPSRPPTSKPRGICKYYTHPRGCFAGESCKFLHGEPSQAASDQPLLTPYDSSKTCRYYQNGFCRRGDECWFLHVAGTSVQSGMDQGSEDDLCSVCFDKPTTFGLLTGCSHVFCITCIRQWRDPNGKGGDMVDSGNTKKCPMCRTPSRFIVSSSRFFRQDDPEKDKIIQSYKDSMAKVPCRYFRQSKQKDKNNPLCPFGKDCFYQHLNDDGTPYIFKDGVDICMRRHRSRNNRSSHPGVFLPFPLHLNGAIGGLDFLFSSTDLEFPWRRNENNNSLNDGLRTGRSSNDARPLNHEAEALNATVEAMRGLFGLSVNNRAFRRQQNEEWRSENDFDDFDEEYTVENEVLETLEMLADEMLVSSRHFHDSNIEPSDVHNTESLPPSEPPVPAAIFSRWTLRDDEDDEDGDDDDLPSLRSVSNSSSGGDDYDDSEMEDNDIGNETTGVEDIVTHISTFNTANSAIDGARNGRMRDRQERLGHTWSALQYTDATSIATSVGGLLEGRAGTFHRNNHSTTNIDDDDHYPVHNNVDGEDLPHLEPLDNLSFQPPSTTPEQLQSNTVISEPPFVTDGRGRVVGASPGPTNSTYAGTRRRKSNGTATDSLDVIGDSTSDDRESVTSSAI